MPTISWLEIEGDLQSGPTLTEDLSHGQCQFTEWNQLRLMTVAEDQHLTLRLTSDDKPETMPAGVWKFAPDQQVRLGRSSECEVVVQHKLISRIHGTFAFRDGSWHFSSVGTNGSFVDSAEVDHVPVQDGLEVELGGSRISVVCSLVSATEFDTQDSYESRGSITDLLSGFAIGDEQSSQELWARCFATIVRMARENLKGASKRMADEEDVAASVFESLFFGAIDGKFPDITNRDSLWRLVVVMTRRKAADYVNHERREKRGSGNVRGDSVFPEKSSYGNSPGFDRFIGSQPSPMMVALLEENMSQLLDRLPSDEHRQIAMLRMEGYTDAEAADELGVSVRTVERRLQTTRTVWAQWLSLAGDDETEEDDALNDD